MSETFEVPDRVRQGSPNPITDLDSWRREVARAAADPDGYWLGVTKNTIVWKKPPTRGLVGNFRTVTQEPLAWFSDGTLNITESCLDRHVDLRGDKVAILWESDEPGKGRTLTYKELHREVCRTANALKKLGLQKGERAIIYMG